MIEKQKDITKGEATRHELLNNTLKQYTVFDGYVM